MSRQSYSRPPPDGEENEEGSEHGGFTMSIQKYSIPLVDGISLSTDLPTFAIKNFELKSGVIQIVLHIITLHLTEDSNQHLNIFLHLCSTFRHHRVSEDIVKLRLFPFSLCNKAHT